MIPQTVKYICHNAMCKHVLADLEFLYHAV